MPLARTVLGDVPSPDLGVCDAHDHLFFRSAQLARQELDDADAATTELRSFGDLGGQAVVQWTPFGLGRRADLLAEVSRASGVAVIAATGLHQAAHYDDPAVVRAILPRLAGLFIEELTTGMRRDPDLTGGGSLAGRADQGGGVSRPGRPRAGDHVAAAEAHQRRARRSACTTRWVRRRWTCRLLCGQLEIPATVYSATSTAPDPPAAQTGAFLAFDGPSRANHATDWRLHEGLAELVRHGHEDQILIGGDTTTAAARASTGGGPGLPYLLRVLRPRLAAELGDAVAEKFFVRNPARAFSWA